MSLQHPAFFARSPKGGLFLLNLTTKEARSEFPDHDLIAVSPGTTSTAFRKSLECARDLVFSTEPKPGTVALITCKGYRVWSDAEHCFVVQSRERIAGRPKREFLLLGYTIAAAYAVGFAEKLDVMLAPKGAYL